jgi:alcohol dehydrogenase
MDISFKLDPETVIGLDTISMAGTICGRYADRVMIAADQALDMGVVKRLTDILEDSGIDVIIFDGIHEDSGVEMADNIVELGRAAHCKAIIGFGGPKTQTIARMSAIMAPMRMPVFELLDGRKNLNKFFPYIAIPTTGVDIFMFTDFIAVVDPRDRIVKPVKTPDKLCAAAIIDSNLSFSLSGAGATPYIFDGFCTAMESYCSTKSNFLSDAMLERALSMYIRMMKSGAENIDADENAQAGFLSSLGAAFSSPGLGVALSLAINARFPVTRQLCGTALLPLLAQKLVAARPEKMARIASLLGNTGGFPSVSDAANSSIDGIRRCMEAFNARFNLKDMNIPLDKVIAVAEAARNLDFVSNTPWTVSEEDVFELLKQIL